MLTCDNRVWHVHKHILCRVTSIFDYGSYTQRKDLFNGITADAVDAMCFFLYTGSYNDRVGIDYDSLHNTGAMWLNVQVHVAARRLSISSLALLSTLKFTQRALPLLTTEKFAAAVKEIYTVFPELNYSLQASVIGMCKEDAEEILTGKSKLFVYIRKVAQEVPLFAAQLEHHTKSKTRKRRAVSEAHTPTNGSFAETYEIVCAAEAFFTCRSCNKAVRAIAEGEVMRFCPYCGSAKNRYIR